MKLDQGYSIVVPVFNSQDSLAELIRRIETVMTRHSSNFEVILVDDCSKDNSWNEIRKLSEAHNFVRGFRLMKNSGQHNALLAGIRKAIYERIITIDDDLQNPPEEIDKLAPEMNSFDVVYGFPEDQKHSLTRSLLSEITKIILAKVMQVPAARRVSSFRIFKTKLRNSFASYDSPYVNIDVLLSWGTNNFSYVYVDHKPRAYGRTNYNFFKLFKHTVTMITGFSVIPLQLASFVGFLLTVFGLSILSYSLFNYFYSNALPGFTFIASMVAIFSGAQMFCLGIIGEYISRIHYKTMNKPSYVLDESTDNNDKI